MQARVQGADLCIFIPKQAISTVMPKEAIGSGHVSVITVHHVQAHRLHVRTSDGGVWFVSETD